MRPGACAGDRRRPPGYSTGARDLHDAAQRARGAVGIAVDQEADHVGDVLLRAREPVLQRQEIGAHVLRGARDEAQESSAAGAASSSGRRALDAACLPGLPRRRFSKASGAALPRPSMSNWPTRVSLHDLAGRHAADHRVAVRRAAPASAGSTARMCSSRNSIVAMTMSAAGDVGVAALPAPPRSPLHSAAACIASVEARQLAAQRARGARQRRRQMTVHRDHDDPDGRGGQRPKCALASYSVSRVIDRQAAFQREALGVAARLAAHEERNLSQFLLGVALSQVARSAAARSAARRRPVATRGSRRDATAPASSWNSKSSRNMPSRCSSRPIISGCTQVSKMHVGAFEAHLRRVARREILHMHRRRDHRAGNAQPLGDVALHLRAEHQLGLQLGDRRLDLEIVVGDQRLDAVALRRPRARRGRTRGCRCRARRR